MGCKIPRWYESLLVYAHDVVSLKLVWHCAVANTSDHGRHGGTLLDEIFSADWVVEALADGNVAEQDAVACRVGSHKESISTGWSSGTCGNYPKIATVTVIKPSTRLVSTSDRIAFIACPAEGQSSIFKAARILR